MQLKKTLGVAALSARVLAQQNGTSTGTKAVSLTLSLAETFCPMVDN